MPAPKPDDVMMTADLTRALAQAAARRARAGPSPCAECARLRTGLLKVLAMVRQARADALRGASTTPQGGPGR